MGKQKLMPNIEMLKQALNMKPRASEILVLFELYKGTPKIPVLLSMN